MDKRCRYMIIAVLLLLAVAGITYIMVRPSFGYLPSGSRLARIQNSPNYKNGQFRKLSPSPVMTTRKSRISALYGFFFADKKGIRPSAPLKAVKTDIRTISTDTDCIIWFGHSSYMLQAGGKRFLVDPVFHAAAPLKIFNRPFPGTDIYRPEDIPRTDYLIITHDHWDHLDCKTVKELNAKTGKVICPLGVGEHFEHWGYEPSRIVELDWYEEFTDVNGIAVHALPARHFSGRGLRQNKTLWASFMIVAPAMTLYIGGDGGYDTHFAEIGRRFSPISWAILENGQYNDAWRYMHTLPPQLEKIAEQIKPGHIMTVHHSKYALSVHPWDEPLKNAARLKSAVAADVVIPAIGEVVPLNR